MTDAGSNQTSGPTGRTKSPDQVLSALQQKLQANQAEASRLTSEAEMLQNDVAGLQSGLDAVESAVTAYTAAGLPAVQSELNKSLEDLQTCVTAVLGDEAGAAQRTVEDLQSDIATAVRARDDAQTTHDTAVAKVGEKTAEADDLQKAWDNLLALTDHHTGDLAAVASLRDQARSAEANNNTFGAYARISEATRRLELLGELSTDDYRQKLVTTWTELANARESVRATRLDLAQAEIDLTAKTSALEALTTDPVAGLEQRWKHHQDTAVAPPAPPEAPPDSPATPVTPQAPDSSPATPPEPPSSAPTHPA